jgi:hypothetical protein
MFIALVAFNTTPAVTIVQKTRAIYIGRRINIIYDAHRNANCETHTARYLWTWYQTPDGERLRLYVPLESSDVSILSAGQTEKIIISFEQPRGLWDGEWWFWSKSINDCKLFHFFDLTVETLVLDQVPLKIQGTPPSVAADGFGSLEREPAPP